MKNLELLENYVNGEKSAEVTNHLGYRGDKLIHYSTTICVLDREAKVAKFNGRKYSTSTSKIQNYLLAILQSAGYQIEEYSGNPAYLWNAGYQGAPKLTLADI